MRSSLISILLLALALPALAAASPEPPPPGTPPSLTGLEMTERAILAPNTPKSTNSELPRQTTFSFFVNENATVHVLFKQVLKGGRLVQRGSLGLDGLTGKNRIHFAGKTPKPKGGIQFLSPGRYRAFFKARNPFGASQEPSISFRLVRPKN
jgi:hypothetical protein